MNDLNGLAISTGSEAARAAFDRTLRSYTGNRVDISDHLGAALAADPGFALGHCVKGYLMMLMYNAAVAPKVKQAHATAGGLAANPREKLHIEALGAWSEGRPARSAAAYSPHSSSPNARHESTIG